MLQESLDIMNNSGEHWVQGNFHKITDTGPNALHQYCMMGGLGKARNKRVGAVIRSAGQDVIEKLKAIVGNVDGEILLQRNEQDAVETWENEAADARRLNLRSLTRMGEDVREIAKVEQETFDVAEVALAWATWEYAAKQPADDSHETPLYDISILEMTSSDADGKTTYKIRPMDSNSTIVSMNDHHATNWDDVKAIHELAIKSLRDGTAPITWRGVSKVLTSPDPERYKIS